jgi:hypothetical protein
MEDTDVWTPEHITAPERRLRFGDEPHQTIPAEWAERGIYHLFAHDKPAFRRMMLAIVGIDDAPRPGRKPANG